MDAVTDEFLTASADGTVRLWDLRTPACNGVIRCGTTPCVASDLQGLIFAAATDDGELKLYDARKYGQGPFIDFQVGSVDPGTGKRPRVTCAKFSPDGEGVLCVAGGTMYIIDAFKGDELMRINVGAETGTFISILVWAITCRMTSCSVYRRDRVPPVGSSSTSACSAGTRRPTGGAARRGAAAGTSYSPRVPSWTTPRWEAARFTWWTAGSSAGVDSRGTGRRPGRCVYIFILVTHFYSRNSNGN